MAQAYIVDALRSPTGRRKGGLSHVHAIDLGAHVLKALVERNAIPADEYDDVIFGCVDTIGSQAGDIARTAWLAAGLPLNVPGTTVDRQCGSSQQALQFAAQAVMSGTMDVVIAAGVESMTRVPMGLSAALPAQNGFGNYMSPRMQERYPNIQFSQFMGAEMVAKKYGLTKDEIDEYSFQSHQRAIAATQAGHFKNEIVGVEIVDAEGNKSLHTVDEGIRFDASLDGIKGVKLLAEGGALTAASSSQICDGASAVMVVSEKGLKELGVKPLARIHHLSLLGHDPVIMLEAPLPASDRALKRAGMSVDDIDLFEVNEAFGSVPVAYMKHLGVARDKINVNGGAIALGHPLGASGTKLMATLLNALEQRGGRYGLQTMCEGGGMANVTIVERL